MHICLPFKHFICILLLIFFAELNGWKRPSVKNECPRQTFIFATGIHNITFSFNREGVSCFAPDQIISVMNQSRLEAHRQSSTIQ